MKQELDDWTLISKTPLRESTRQKMLDDIQQDQSVEPETDPKHISDCQLFLLWLRS